MKDINVEIVKALKQHLLSDEDVLWSEKPARLDRRILTYLLIFILLFVVVLIYPISLALMTGDYSGIAAANITYNGIKLDESVTTEDLVTILIVTASLLSFATLIFVGVVVYRYRQVYAITLSRVLIKRQFPLFGIASVYFQNISYLTRTGNQKIGTITVIDVNDGIIDKLLRLNQLKLSTLYNISHPEMVEMILQQQIQLSRE